jgi:hypothetical protein
MHPQIVSDKPGICPICQMTLQRVDGTEARWSRERMAIPRGCGIDGAESRSSTAIRGPTSSPRSRERRMGMAYIPVYEDEPRQRCAEHAAFRWGRQQLIGVTKAHLERRPLEIAFEPPAASP